MLKWAGPSEPLAGAHAFTVHTRPTSRSQNWPAYQVCGSLPPQLVSMGPLLRSVSLVQISFTNQPLLPWSSQLQALCSLSDIHTAGRAMDLRDSLYCVTPVLQEGPPCPADFSAPRPSPLMLVSALCPALLPLTSGPHPSLWASYSCILCREPRHCVPPRPSTPSGTTPKVLGYVPGAAMSASLHLLF